MSSREDADGVDRHGDNRLAAAKIADTHHKGRRGDARRHPRGPTRLGGAPQNHSADLPDQGGLVTYPVLTTAPNGDVYLICRVDDGNSSSRSGRLYRWSNSARTWSRVAVFACNANGIDVLYLVDLTNLRLYYGRN